MNRLSGLRDFLLIWSGQLISEIGSRLSSFALSVWVLRKTGSTTQFALTLFAMAIPAMLISPLAGPVVDRGDRRKIMIGCDLVAPAAMLVLAGLWLAGNLSIWHIYAAVAMVSLCEAFREHVRTIAAINTARGTRTIFIAQILNKAHKPDPSEERDVWALLLRRSDFVPLQARFNSVLQEAAAASSARFIDPGVDNFQGSDFVDLGHFSVVGARKFAGLVADQVGSYCQ